MSSGISRTRAVVRTPPDLKSEPVSWSLTSAPWSSSSPLIALVVELLPTIDDEVEVDLIEQLAVLVVERDEQIRAQREIQSVCLDELHRMRCEIERLRDQAIAARVALRQKEAAT